MSLGKQSDLPFAVLPAFSLPAPRLRILTEQLRPRCFIVFPAQPKSDALNLMIDEKSNEIPAAPELIEALGLKGCLFTLDAEHCQKKASPA